MAVLTVPERKTLQETRYRNTGDGTLSARTIQCERQIREAKPTQRRNLLPRQRQSRQGDHLVHDRDHIEYWAQLVSIGTVPNDEYEEHPRGRVAYNDKTRKYTLLADRCILGKKSFVPKIVSRLNLPVGRTKVDTDAYYRCFRCLGRSC